MEASGPLYILCIPVRAPLNLLCPQDIIGEDPATHGSMMVPLLLGSDKTLASNATGQNEFHPLYFSPGNVKNSVRRAHCDALVPIGFLAIPKSISHVLRCLLVSSHHVQVHGRMQLAHCSDCSDDNCCMNR